MPATGALGHGELADRVIPGSVVAAGMARSYFRPVQTLLTSVYMAMPSSPFSRPRPDIL